MKHLERAWNNYRQLLAEDLPPEHVAELHQAFMSGATILHITIMQGLTPGPGVSQPDVRFMTDIQAEIDEFGQALDQKYLAKWRH